MNKIVTQNGHSNAVRKKYSKKHIVIIGVFTLIILFALAMICINGGNKKTYSFDETVNEFFYRFDVVYPDPSEYEFHSLEAYCIDDDNLPGVIHYFVRAKYTAYISILDKWSEIEKISYGDNGRIENSYCLSWDSIEGFEDANELFNRAVKEGMKKSYTMNEIEELIKKNKPNN